MRILFVVVQFPPDINSTGLLMYQVAQDLARVGHEVTVITTFPHYEKFRVWDRYRGKISQRVRENGLDVHRLWVYAPGKKSMLNRVLSYVSFNLLASLSGVLKSAHWDLVFCPNGSFFTGITGWLIRCRKGIPFVFNVQDLYPEVPVHAGQLHSRSAILTLRNIETFMYRKATHITVISPSMRENLLAKGVPETKVTLIPNFADTKFIRPLPKVNHFGSQHGLNDRFVVTHAGNLGYVYDLETMLEAASRLGGEKRILFLIVGNGVQKGRLERKAQSLKLTNVRFLPFQPIDSLPWLRASSDVQVALYKPNSVKFSMPSKIYEIMASGRTVLASAEKGSDVSELIERTQCGMCVEPGRPDELADAIRKLSRGPSMRESMAENGRCCAEQIYSRKAVVQNYKELFARVVGEKQ